MCSSKFRCYRVRRSPSEALEPPSFLTGFRIALGLVLVAGLVFTTSLLVMAKTSDTMNTSSTATPNAGKLGSAEKASKAESPGGSQKSPKPWAASRKPEKWDPERAEREYRLIQFELAMAKVGEVYMVLDMDRREILLKMKGAVVWNCPLEIAPEDSGGLEEFVSRFKDGDEEFVRLLSNRHLFAARDKTPDSILAIVGQVVKTDPSLLQRDLPERFHLFWGWDLILEVRTGIVGEPKSRFRNASLAVLEAVRRPFGGKRLVVKMSADDALTLYRTASPGLPTLLRSSS